jgi:hypothetical protein
VLLASAEDVMACAFVVGTPEVGDLPRAEKEIPRAHRSQKVCR